MTFDYQKQTREHYQDPNVAKAYHREFTSLRGLNGLRFRLVARRERAVAHAFLQTIGPRVVLDIPSGTGKMAVVYKHLGVNVVAADISNEMLDVARKVYSDLSHAAVQFVQCDAENAAGLTTGRNVDVVVCIRLMHRVPADVRQSILKQFAEAAPHLIVSYGVDSRFHRARRSLRRALVGGLDVSASEYATMEQATRELAEHFHVVDFRSVIWGLSNEYLFLAKSKRNGVAKA
jgi:2-polyprenyl-3-methyl-5-hydroxy-6-metoxy-1,4-benzoquinol methylase